MTYDDFNGADAEGRKNDPRFFNMDDEPGDEQRTSGLVKPRMISADDVSLREQALALSVQLVAVSVGADPIDLAKKFLAFLSGSSNNPPVGSDAYEKNLRTFAWEHAENDKLRKEIGRLAEFIRESIPGEPSQSEGAVDTAIRIMCNGQELLESMREQLAGANVQVKKWNRIAIEAESKLAEAQATIEKVREWNEKHGTLTLSEILSAPSSTGDSNLAYEAVHEAAVAVRQHATAPTELVWPQVQVDRLIAWVADWIENPPEWVAVSYREAGN